MANMTIAAEWYQVGGFWISIVAVIVSLSIGVASGWIASRNVQVRRLLYTVDDCTSLIADAGQRSGIQVLHKGNEVTSPHLTRVVVASRSRQDIDDSNFRNGKGIHLISTVPVVSILQIEATPREKVFPTVKLVNPTTIEIEPGIIAKNHLATIELLTEGVADITCRADMANVDVKRMKPSVLEQVDWKELLTMSANVAVGRVFRI